MVGGLESSFLSSHAQHFLRVTRVIMNYLSISKCREQAPVGWSFIWSEENDLIMLVIMLITSKGWIEHMGRQNGMQEVHCVAKTHQWQPRMIQKDEHQKNELIEVTQGISD